MEIFVHRDGQSEGPYDLAQLQAAIAKGHILTIDFIWHAGMTEWRPVNEVFDLGSPDPAPVVTVVPVAVPSPRPVVRAEPTYGATSGTPAARTVRPVTPSSWEVESDDENGEAEGGFPWVRVALICGGGLLFLLLSWLTVTWVIGGSTKSVVTREVRKLEEGVAGKGIKVSLGRYRRGFFSSSVTTSVGPKTESAGEAGEDAVTLLHKFYHGPLALTPVGPKFVQNYVITTLDGSGWSEEVRSGIRSAYGKREPVTIQTAAAFGGASTHTILLAQAVHQAENGVRFEFGGGHVRLTADQGKLAAKGDFVIGNLLMGGVEESGTIRVAESRGTVDVEGGRRFKADCRFGSVGIYEGEKGNFDLDGPVFVADFTASGDEKPIMVGQSSFRLPKIQIASEEMPAGFVKNLSIENEAFVQDGRATYLWRYGVEGLSFESADVGSNAAGPQPGTPESMFQLVERGAKFTVGARGLIPEVLGGLTESWWRFLPFWIDASENPGLLETPEGWEKSREYASTIILGLLELVQPGAEIFAEMEVGGGDAKLELNLGLGGTKKLPDLKTLGEILQAIEGKLGLQLGGAILQDPIIAEAIGQQAQAGLGTLEADRYQLDGVLREGVLSVGGQPTPLLDGLAPQFDQPINWEKLLDELGPPRPLRPSRKVPRFEPKPPSSAESF